MGRRKDSIMARTTKTPSYAPEIPERKTTRKTASSAKKSTANKKAEAAQLETEETKASTTGRAAAAKKKQSRPAKKAEPAPQKQIISEYVEQKPEFIALKQLQIPFYERYLLTVEETSAYFHIGSKKMYEMIQENPEAPWLLLNGNRKMIKREMFARWIDRLSVI